MRGRARSHPFSTRLFQFVLLVKGYVESSRHAFEREIIPWDRFRQTKAATDSQTIGYVDAVARFFN